MIIKKIQMPSRESFYFSQSCINFLRIKTFASFKKSILVTEVTMMRTTSRYNNGIGNQVQISFDQISSDRGNGFNISFLVDINFLRGTLPEIFQEFWKNIFTGT